MSYKPIEIDRENLEIMGVSFDTADNFEATLAALGSNMFEGFEPTPRSIEIIRDYISGLLSLEQLKQITRDKAYA